jgi:hypothetical protein
MIWKKGPKAGKAASKVAAEQIAAKKGVGAVMKRLKMPY